MTLIQNIDERILQRLIQISLCALVVIQIPHNKSIVLLRSWVSLSLLIICAVLSLIKNSKRHVTYTSRTLFFSNLASSTLQLVLLMAVIYFVSTRVSITSRALLFNGDDQSSFLNCVGRLDRSLAGVEYCEGGPLTYQYLSGISRFDHFFDSQTINENIRTLVVSWKILFVASIFFSTKSFILKDLQRNRIFKLFLIVVATFSSSSIFTWFYSRGYLSSLLATLIFSMAITTKTLGDGSKYHNQLAVIQLSIASLFWYPITPVAVTIQFYILLSGSKYGMLKRDSLILSMLCIGSSVISFTRFVPKLTDLNGLKTFARIGGAIDVPIDYFSVLAVLALFFLVLIHFISDKKNFEGYVFLLFVSMLWLVYWFALPTTYASTKTTMCIELGFLLSFPALVSRVSYLNKPLVGRMIAYPLCCLLLFFSAREQPLSKEQPRIVWFDALVSDNSKNTKLCYITNPDSIFSYQVASYYCSKWYAASSGSWSVETADWAQGLIADDRSLARVTNLKKFFQLNPTLEVLTDVPLSQLGNDKYVDLFRNGSSRTFSALSNSVGP